MKNLKSIFLMLPLIAVGAASMIGCVKQPDPYAHRNGNEGNKFDFATTTQIPLNVDYSQKGNKAVFEVYAENPLTVENGVATKRAGVKSLLKTYTDNNSKYSGVIDIPTATSNVWIYSESYGFPTCIRAEVAANGVSVNLMDIYNKMREQAAEKSQTAKGAALRAVTADNPYNVQTLGSWDWIGLPEYIVGVKHQYAFEPTRVSPPAGLINRIQNVLKPGADNSSYARPTDVMNLNVTKDAHVTLVFAAEMAGWKNSIGYYYYDTNNAPKTQAEMDALPKYLAFPNCSSITTNFEDLEDFDSWTGDSASPLVFGEQLKLKYFNGSKSSEIFPGGTTIGWFILPDAYNASSNKVDMTSAKYQICYSNNEFNANKQSRMVSLYDEPSKTTVLGFEDGGDKDYKDILFYIVADPADAIFDPDRPSTDPDEQYPDVTGDPLTGTLAFEDLWPSKGDYDMNDVVMMYSTTFTTDKDNNVVAIEDVFTPLNSGGSQKSAFGYQLDIPASAVKSVTVFSNDNPEGIEGQLEKGQDKAVFMLYGDIWDAVSGDRGSVTLKIELEKGAVSMDRVTRKSLYNPFICVNTEGFKEGSMRKEVHLTNCAPTNLADLSYFGTKDDKSSVDGLGNPVGPYYYGTAQLYPFAIDLPIVDYHIPDERVSIDEFYPGFAAWAASSGKENKDWYLKPAK